MAELEQPEGEAEGVVAEDEQDARTPATDVSNVGHTRPSPSSTEHGYIP